MKHQLNPKKNVISATLNHTKKLSALKTRGYVFQRAGAPTVVSRFLVFFVAAVKAEVTIHYLIEGYRLIASSLNQTTYIIYLYLFIFDLIKCLSMYCFKCENNALKVMLNLTGNQCNWRSPGLILCKM